MRPKSPDLHLSKGVFIQGRAKTVSGMRARRRLVSTGISCPCNTFRRFLFVPGSFVHCGARATSPRRDRPSVEDGSQFVCQGKTQGLPIRACRCPRPAPAQAMLAAPALQAVRRCRPTGAPRPPRRRGIPRRRTGGPCHGSRQRPRRVRHRSPGRSRRRAGFLPGASCGQACVPPRPAVPASPGAGGFAVCVRGVSCASGRQAVCLHGRTHLSRGGTSALSHPADIGKSCSLPLQELRIAAGQHGRRFRQPAREGFLRNRDSGAVPPGLPVCGSGS